MGEEKRPDSWGWGRYYRAKPENKDLHKYVSTWMRYGDTYKCGNCGTIPLYVDISERNICYRCQHVMQYYEKDDGSIVKLKYKYNKYDEAPNSDWEVY